MTRQIQIRRGTATEHENFTGAIGEVTMDTTNKTLRVHDGTTAGGIPLAKLDQTISDLSSLDSQHAHQLIGNRVWISEEYSLSNSANVEITHNLNLTDIRMASAIPYLRFTSAVAGYSIDDIISNFALCGQYYMLNNSLAGVVTYGNLLNLAANTVVIPRLVNQTSVAVFNKSTGVATLVDISKVKVSVKIIY